MACPGPDRSSVRRTDDLSWTCPGPVRGQVTCPDLSAGPVRIFLRTGHLSGTCPRHLSAFFCGQVTCPAPVRSTCPQKKSGQVLRTGAGQVSVRRTGPPDRPVFPGQVFFAHLSDPTLDGHPIPKTSPPPYLTHREHVPRGHPGNFGHVAILAIFADRSRHSGSSPLGTLHAQYRQQHRQPSERQLHPRRWGW